MASTPPSESRALVPIGGPAVGQVLGRVRGFAAQPAVAKSLPLIAFVAVLGIAALAWSLLAQPPQRNIFNGLADADKAAVAEALTSAEIDYTLDKETGALSVADGDFYRARMLLAQQGLPKSAPDGDRMISSLPLGASRAIEGERLRGARELDLARTIEAIDAVASARVLLAMEAPSVFMRDRSQPAASVMLTLRPGRTLSEGQVRAISHLVASSVPSLTPDKVSIVDQTGRLLSKTGTGDPDSDAASRQVEVQQQIEARYLEAVTKLLTPILGADNFTAEVHADVDFSEVQATRESYPPSLGGVRQEGGGWTREGGPEGINGLGGGVPGALSNTPPPAAVPSATPPPGQAAAPDPNAPPGPAAATPPPRTNENYTRTFELGREVSVTRQPVGAVKRVSVAVALRQPAGKPRARAEITAIESLVKGAVGFDQARGDQIAISARNFAAAPELPAESWWEAPWMAMLARNLTGLLVALLLVFGIGRPLMKRVGNATRNLAAGAATPSDSVGREIVAALVDEARANPSKPVTLDMIEAAPGYTARAELIRNFVRQDPARAALVVRDLIRADASPTPGGETRNG